MRYLILVIALIGLNCPPNQKTVKITNGNFIVNKSKIPFTKITINSDNSLTILGKDSISYNYTESTIYIDN